METEIKPQGLPKTPEQEAPQNKLRDYSGLEEWFVHQQTEHILPYAERMVVFPDLGPTEKDMVPTGSITEVDVIKHPDWLKLVSGADIGCGMILARITPPITKQEFITRQQSFDELRDKIKADKAVSLGGGNHFIDFATDEESGEVFVLIHTGAYRNKQRKFTKIVKSAEADGNWKEATAEYMEEYQKVIQSATENRLAILKKVSEIYGNCEIQSHEAHNTIELNSAEHTVTIYKGVIHIDDPSKRQVMPSSMVDYIDYYLPGPTIGENTLWGAPHGTGRAKSRKEMKKDDDTDENTHIVPEIMLPNGVTPPRTELPDAYRSSVRAEEIMLENGLMRLQETDDIRQFKPFAYMGHL